MSGCGSESKGADRYIDLLDDTRVDTHGLYLYDLEAPSGSTGTNKGLFRMASRCVLNVDGIQLAGTASTQGVQNALLECGTASVTFAVQDVLLFNNGASPLTPELCKGTIPTGSLFRPHYGSYSGFYRYTADGLTPTIAFTVPDASVTPAKTTFIQPAEGHYETQPNYTNVFAQCGDSALRECPDSPWHDTRYALRGRKAEFSSRHGLGNNCNIFWLYSWCKGW